MDQPQKGRASLVRLQAVVDSPSTEVAHSSSSNADSGDSVSKITSVDSSNQYTTKNYGWTVSTSDSSASHDQFSSITEDIQDSTSTSNFGDVPNSQEMQRFLTSDGQYVYGYKDPKGEFHFFYPAMNDRESHNEKERKRRSRVSDACSSLRKLVPGLNDKTDKASVFEQAVRYLKFLRDKYGTQFDQVYCEKYFVEKS